MLSAWFEIMGICISMVGWMCAVTCCAVPLWKVTSFIGNNIVVAQLIWEGLWMNCVVQSSGHMQCKIYDSLLTLPQDLQAARALTIISILMAILGLFISIVGAKCTNCVEDAASKARVMVVAGAIFILSGVLCLIPVCWSTSTVVQDFFDPEVDESLKRELGPSLYIGMGASVMLVLGGAMLCCSCPPRDEHRKQQVGYRAASARSRAAPANFNKQDYV
ncbi:claudin-4-like [Lissotriton helveticus]